MITAVTPRVTRRTATGAALRAEQPTGVGARGEGPEQRQQLRREDPFGLRDTGAQASAASRGSSRSITGLLAAVIGAGVVTASELAIFGHQVGNSDRSTGLLGGSSSSSATATPTPTATPTATEDATETPTATATPTATETATPTATVTPSATETPHRRAAAGDADADRPPRPPRSRRRTP